MTNHRHHRLDVRVGAYTDYPSRARCVRPTSLCGPLGKACPRHTPTTYSHYAARHRKDRP